MPPPPCSSTVTLQPAEDRYAARTRGGRTLEPGSWSRFHAQPCPNTVTQWPQGPTGERPGLSVGERTPHVSDSKRAVVRIEISNFV